MSLQIYILTKLMEGDSYPYELKKHYRIRFLLRKWRT